MNKPRITVLGVGNILFGDEGFGVRVIEKMRDRCEFPQEVNLVDGGVLGLNLLGTISAADYLIIVDAILNKGKPGDIYRLEGDQIPKRILAKNSLHQVDLLEALTLCQALDKAPETVIIGVEPADIETMQIEMTPIIQSKVDEMIDLVLAELDRLHVPYRRRPLNRQSAIDHGHLT